MTELDVAILGAGTAGLTAQSEVAKATDSYVVFDPGPLGTTCARTACMPSKAFLQSAHDFHRRHAFKALGITGGAGLGIDGPAVLAATRAIRDDLVEGVVEGMADWRDTHLVRAAAAFAPDGTLQAGDRRFRARSVVVATGTAPAVPDGWRARFGDRIRTSDDFFELEDLPARAAVVGLGAVGLELGQALARLGVEVTAFDPSESIGGVTDPEACARLRAAIGGEMKIVAHSAEPEEGRDGAVLLRWPEGSVEVDMLLVAAGRRSVIGDLGLEHLGVKLKDGRPELEQSRLDAPGTGVYFAGDVAAGPALLHEAADEGRVAGYHAARGTAAEFRRRVPLRLVFCAPQIAVVGEDWSALEKGGMERVAIGAASLDRAGRTRVSRQEGGLLRIYAERGTGRLLGATLVAPAAEHMGHLLAHALDQDASLRDLLRMPVYHPTQEEPLRRALRDAQSACDVEEDELERDRCDDAPTDAT